MDKQSIIIVGTGPEARIMLDICNLHNVLVLGMVKPNGEDKLSELNDVTVFGAWDGEDVNALLRDESMEWAVASDDADFRLEVRKAVGEIAKKPLVTVSHPNAYVSEYAKVGAGCLVSSFVSIQANAEVGELCQLHSHVSIETDAVIGEGTRLMSGVRVGGNVTVGKNCFIGTGAILYPGVKVGDGAMIGAGSVVLREVKEGAVVHGNPAAAV